MASGKMSRADSLANYLEFQDRHNQCEVRREEKKGGREGRKERGKKSGREGGRGGGEVERRDSIPCHQSHHETPPSPPSPPLHTHTLTPTPM